MKFMRFVFALAIAGFAQLRVHSDVPDIFLLTLDSLTVGETNFIIGANFDGGATPNVYFGGTNFPGNVVDYGDTYIEVIVPANAPAAGRITVQNSFGTSTPSTAIFYVAPGIDSTTRWVPVATNPVQQFQISPGDEVQIAGERFKSPNGFDIGTQVFIGNVAATITNLTDTNIVVIVPTNAVTGYISVSTVGASAKYPNSYYFIQPHITGFTSTAIVGGTINVSGSSFLGVTNVTIGNAEVSLPDFSIQGDTGTNILVTIPASAPTHGPISVTSGGKTTTTLSDFILQPSITALSTNAGLPGDTIVLGGYALEDATSVYFGNVAAAPSNLSHTSATVIVPAGAVTGPLTVNTPHGSYTTSNLFYLPPTLTGFSPMQGAVGDVITLTGTGLLGVTNITIGGVPVSDFKIEGTNGTEILVTIPPNTPSNGAIAITSGGNTITFSGNFNLLPSITGISVDAGSLGTFVTINGFGLTGATNVSFGGINQAIAFSSDTSITISVPTNGLAGPPSVNTPNGAYTNLALVYNPPVVTSFSPDRAKVGDWIILSGTNLTSITNVTIGAITEPDGGIQYTNNGANLLLRIPAIAPLSGQIGITRAGNTFTTDSNFLLLPAISHPNVGRGSKGDSVTFFGFGLANVTNVVFGGGAGATPTATTSSSLTVVIPSGALTGTILVGSPNGSFESSQTFEVGPEITGFDPGTGASGTSVILSGFNLTNATSVSFNGIATANFIVQSDSSISATVPPGTTTGTVSVTTPFGTFTTADSFYVGPTITSFTPFRGPTGTVVTITGHNLAGTTSVSFNGTPATTFTISNDTTLVVTVPEGATTGPVQVGNSSGSNQSKVQYIVVTPADLKLQMLADNDAPTVGSDISVSFTISNQGPKAAAGVKGVFISSADATVTGASVMQGTSTTSTAGANFDIGNLPLGTTVTGTVTLHVSTNGVIDLNMTTSGTTSDPNPADNTVALHLQTSAITLQILNSTNSVVQLTWPIAGVGYLLEQSPTLSPASWSGVTNTPSSDAAKYSVDLPSTNASMFYRLRKP